MEAKNTVRKPRSYKCSDKFYKKAMRRAKKEKTTLANVVESLVIGYAMEFDKNPDYNPNPQIPPVSLS